MPEKVVVHPGFPHGAPIGYLNVKDLVAGRQVARIVPDPDRAPLVTVAFEHYASGDWTLQRLAGELGHQGLTNRGRRDRPVKATPRQGDHLARPRQDPRQPGLYRHRLLGWRRAPRSPRAAHHRRNLPPGPRAARRPFGARHPRAQSPPLPQRRSALRGVRKAPVDPALQGPLHLLLLPRPEERPRRHLPGALHSGRRSRSPSRAALHSHPATGLVGRTPARRARRRGDRTPTTPPSASCSPAGSPRLRPNGASSSTPTTAARSTSPP